jgi:hypothetical protein
MDDERRPYQLAPIERLTSWGTKDPTQHYACPIGGCEFLSTDPEDRCPYHHFRGFRGGEAA